MPSTTTKRQNFDVTPEQEAEIVFLQEALGAGSAKDAILRAIHLSAVLSREVKGGKRIGLIDHRAGGRITEVILPDLEPATSGWLYLVTRSHSWKKQLFVKGRKLTAAQVWLDMQVNQFSVADAMENWDLPEAAIAEIVSYCERHSDLLRAEAEEEKLNLLQRGVALSR
jgi:hypothetical protein